MYTVLWETGFQVSSVGLGSMVFGCKTDSEQAIKIEAHLFDHGVNLVDTSNSYGQGTS
mgnify:CR=1 FL=1